MLQPVPSFFWLVFRNVAATTIVLIFISLLPTRTFLLSIRHARSSLAGILKTWARDLETFIDVMVEFWASRNENEKKWGLRWSGERYFAKSRKEKQKLIKSLLINSLCLSLCLCHVLLSDSLELLCWLLSDQHSIVAEIQHSNCLFVAAALCLKDLFSSSRSLLCLPRLWFLRDLFFRDVSFRT